MIQRVQSIYLLLGSIAFALVSFKIPFWSFNKELISTHNDSKMFALTCSACLLSLVTIFLFKNRTWQLKLIKFAVIIEFVIGVRAIMMFKEFRFSTTNSVLFLLGFTLVALFLAYKGVKKDEDLVRSVDRIR